MNIVRVRRVRWLKDEKGGGDGGEIKVGDFLERVTGEYRSAAGVALLRHDCASPREALAIANVKRGNGERK